MNATATTHRIINGDCLRWLPRLASESANLVLSDPPYGIGYESWTGESVINDDGPFIWWLREAWRITTSPGAIACFCRWDVQEVWRSAIESAGFTIRGQVIWNKILHTCGDTRATFAPMHEVIWFATKGRFAFPGNRPKSILTHRRRLGVHVDPTRTHPTEKPVALMRELIEHLTRPGDMVVDPFCGTGATIVAAKECGRSAIGVELERHYALIARSRVRAADVCEPVPASVTRHGQPTTARRASPRRVRSRATSTRPDIARAAG